MKTNLLLLSVLVSLPFACVGQGVFAERFSLLGLPDDGQPIDIGIIPGTPGMYIHLLELGIGGEPDAASGPTIFSVEGSGLDVSWGAGQRAFSATYSLTPTLSVPGPIGACGFTYQPVSLFTTEVGGALNVRFLSSQDADGLFTYGADASGILFDDSAFPSSSRVWLQYEYVSIPEPASGVLLVSGLALLAVCRRRGAGRDAFHRDPNCNHEIGDGVESVPPQPTGGVRRRKTEN